VFVQETVKPETGLESSGLRPQKIRRGLDVPRTNLASGGGRKMSLDNPLMKPLLQEGQFYGSLIGDSVPYIMLSFQVLLVRFLGYENPKCNGSKGWVVEM